MKESLRSLEVSFFAGCYPEDTCLPMVTSSDKRFVLLAEAAARGEGLSRNVWANFMEQCFIKGNGRLFLRVVMPQGKITARACVKEFLLGGKTAGKAFVRFRPGKMPVVANANGQNVFIVIDFCRSTIEDVIAPGGGSLLGKGNPSPAIELEPSHDLIPRLMKAVRDRVQHFRVPDILLWFLIFGDLDLREEKAVIILIGHDLTAYPRLCRFEKACKTVALRRARRN